MRTLKIVDLFCGAGGTSTGILKACDAMLRPVELIAVNHWKTAINTHTLNHPRVKHLCENVETIFPRTVVPGGRLDLLAASCECTFHSNARGGGPCNEQSRSQPWQLIRWATDLHVENILMENVREFRNWGPIHARTKRPIKSRKGEYFKSFCAALENLGYVVEHKIQVAADFGDPTSRPRLMLIAKKGKAISWPEPSHGPGRATPWRVARECIDWDLKGKSVFANGKPRLCANTMRRIAAGLKKFGGLNAEPFLVMLNGTTEAHVKASARSMDEPMPTVVANGNHVALCEPFITNMKGQSLAMSLDEPTPTITAHAPHLQLVEPFIIPPEGFYRGNVAKSLDVPLITITGSRGRAIQLIEPIIVQTDQTGGNGAYSRSVDSPLATIVSKQNMLLVEPFIVKYYGAETSAESIDEPLDTVTTRDRFCLVETKSGRTIAELDIRTRMLQPHELAAAHSFPKNYQFTGTKGDQTKQIGNSVPVELAAAHAEAALS